MPISKIKAGGINDDAVTTAKIVDGTVAAVDIADGAVTSAKLDTNIDITGTLDVTGNLTADSSATVDGNLLVGRNTVGVTGETGHVIRGNDSVLFSRTGNSDASEVMQVNKNSYYGALVDLRYEGVVKGQIGFSTDGPAIGTSTRQIAVHSDKLFPAQNYGSGLDNTLDLGYSGGRWKDLFLSGGAYIGGTGAANYLDDYEEGTWTPTLTFGGSSTGITYNGSAGGNAGQFVKIGQMVWLWFNIYLSNKGSATGDIRITGAPFTAANTYYNENGGSLHDWINFNSVRSYISTYFDSLERIQLRHMNFNSGSATGMQNMNNTHLNNNSFLRGYVCYRTSD